MILINPRTPDRDRIEKLLSSITDFPNHTWIATSGSSGNPKFVALSQVALYASAQAVNQHLDITQSDIWINPLPLFHVGGLGIQKRAELSHSKVIPLERWDPHAFCALMQEEKATFSSLVPTQVFDLVLNQLVCPKNVRGIIVGGGKLDETLSSQAKDLGWPLLASYGLTECASQVATGASQLKILPHITLKIVNDHIWIKSPSLLSAYALLSKNIEIIDPKVDGWFETEDRGELNPPFLNIYGRDSSFIKIGGESVNLTHLESHFTQVKLELNPSFDSALFATPDPRLGRVIHLAVATTPQPQVEALSVAYNARVHPYERIRHIHYLDSIPRSPLGKQMLFDKKIGFSLQ